MNRSVAAVALLLASGIAAAALSGCSGTRAFIAQGDAKSVEIDYGPDLSQAWPLAQRHCAEYERVPRLVDPGAVVKVAVFDCVPQ